ncbi:unnamed protein product, partial [Onchocerca flexuosa]|uniref:Syndecan domain-containing protein n=1 Tax=Onchocerca flexuosa TaxID=387005 RepID=A0A183HRP8_9BILA
ISIFIKSIILQCPQASFCLPISGERRHLPTWIEPYLQRSITVTSSSTIRILLPNASEPSLDNDESSISDELVAESDDNLVNVAYDSKCARVCAVAVEKALKKEEECHLDGIPIYVVIVIVIISFAFGVAFVATLWFIHNRTGRYNNSIGYSFDILVNLRSTSARIFFPSSLFDKKE